MKIAPCREYGSIDNNNDIVIAVHNYEHHFGKIDNLHVEDLVMFTDMNDVTNAYRVESIEILKPDQVGEVRYSAYDLTMYTCTYGGQTRVVVRSKLFKPNNTI